MGVETAVLEGAYLGSPLPNVTTVPRSTKSKPLSKWVNLGRTRVWMTDGPPPGGLTNSEEPSVY
jgi:hypothetical protein